MKKLIIFAALSLVMAISHVSYAQDESPGKSVTIENQTHAPAIVAADPSNFSFAFVQTPQPARTEIAFVMPKLVSHQAPGSCITDYGSCRLLFSSSINVKKYFAYVKQPAHQTQNCAKGYMC